MNPLGKDINAFLKSAYSRNLSECHMGTRSIDDISIGA